MEKFIEQYGEAIAYVVLFLPVIGVIAMVLAFFSGFQLPQHSSKGGELVKEIVKQHGGMIAEAAGGIIIIGLIGAAFLGGGLGWIAKMLSAWMYG